MGNSKLQEQWHTEEWRIRAGTPRSVAVQSAVDVVRPPRVAADLLKIRDVAARDDQEPAPGLSRYIPMSIGRIRPRPYSVAPARRRWNHTAKITLPRRDCRFTCSRAWWRPDVSFSACQAAEATVDSSP